MLAGDSVTWTDWSAEIGPINKSTKKNIYPENAVLKILPKE